MTAVCQIDYCQISRQATRGVINMGQGNMLLENAPPLPPRLHYLPSKFQHILDQIPPEQFHVLCQSTLPPSLLPESSQVFALGPKLGGLFTPPLFPVRLWPDWDRNFNFFFG